MISIAKCQYVILQRIYWLQNQLEVKLFTLNDVIQHMDLLFTSTFSKLYEGFKAQNLIMKIKSPALLHQVYSHTSDKSRLVSYFAKLSS